MLFITFAFVEEYLQLTFDKLVFKISAILHPSTYLNKILLGSEQGSLQLWNVKSKWVLYLGYSMGDSYLIYSYLMGTEVSQFSLSLYVYLEDFHFKYTYFWNCYSMASHMWKFGMWSWYMVGSFIYAHWKIYTNGLSHCKKKKIM